MSRVLSERFSVLTVGNLVEDGLGLVRSKTCQSYVDFLQSEQSFCQAIRRDVGEIMVVNGCLGPLTSRLLSRQHRGGSPPLSNDLGLISVHVSGFRSQLRITTLNTIIITVTINSYQIRSEHIISDQIISDLLALIMPSDNCGK